MARFADDSLMDIMLNDIKTRPNLLTVCAGQPVGRTSAITIGGQALAQVVISSTDFTGPADGDVSGRKIAVDQQTGLTVSATGDGDHVCLTTAASLLYITTATTQTLTSGNSLTVNAWDIEILDPSA